VTFIGHVIEAIRRWIRSGRLRSQKDGAQHVVDEEELGAIVDEEYEMLPLPAEIRLMADGRPQPNWVRILRQARDSR
jgi:hypothetical protein